MEENTRGAQQFAQADQDEMEIDLMELFYMLLDHWKAIFLAFLAGAVVLGAVCTFLLSSEYEANTSIYITENDSSSDLTVSDVQLSAYLADDFVEIVQSYTVLSQVISDLGLDSEDIDITYSDLLEMIEVEVPDSTHIVTITVTASDPVLARDIVNQITEVSVEKFYEIVGSIMPSVIDYSSINNVELIQPGISKYLVIGALLGAVLMCAFLVIRTLVDTTIKTEDDIEKYLGLPVLASVPRFED